MSKTARQIVAKLLEYGMDTDAPRPGSPDDPWRKGGHMKLHFKKMDFKGKRLTKPVAKAKEEKSKKRFNWEPPTVDESALFELGGYYCYGCHSPTSPTVDGATGKLTCQKCGAAINYSHPKLSAPRDMPMDPDARRRERPFPQHNPI